jgi:hypothetical protein
MSLYVPACLQLQAIRSKVEIYELKENVNKKSRKIVLVWAVIQSLDRIWKSTSFSLLQRMRLSLRMRKNWLNFQTNLSCALCQKVTNKTGQVKHKNSSRQFKEKKIRVWPQLITMWYWNSLNLENNTWLCHYYSNQAAVCLFNLIEGQLRT